MWSGVDGWAFTVARGEGMSTLMTQSELEHALKAMQQQWYDLVVAEQQGSPLGVLEHMYDTYILLAEEYNRCYEASQQERQAKLRHVA